MFSGLLTDLPPDLPDPPQNVLDGLTRVLTAFLEAPEVRRAIHVLSTSDCPEIPSLNGEATLFCAMHRSMMHDAVAEQNRLGGSSACLDLTKAQKQLCAERELSVLQHRQEFLNVKLAALALALAKIPRTGKIFRSKKAFFAFLGYPYPKQSGDYAIWFKGLCLFKPMEGTRKIKVSWDSPLIEVFAQVINVMKTQSTSSEMINLTPDLISWRLPWLAD